MVAYETLAVISLEQTKLVQLDITSINREEEFAIFLKSTLLI